MSEKLSIKQKQFCDAYLTNNGNATAAAISAGYSKSSAGAIGSENLKKQSIADYIDHISNENKPKPELKHEPERIVLKWTKFYEKDQRTHPADGQKVLVCSFHGCDAVCNFEKTYKIFVTTETNSVLDKVYAWMSVPSPHFVDDMGITYVDAEINNEYLIEQTTLETFDIIDAITPALREAVKHLLAQQGANK